MFEPAYISPVKGSYRELEDIIPLFAFDPAPDGPEVRVGEHIIKRGEVCEFILVPTPKRGDVFRYCEQLWVTMETETFLVAGKELATVKAISPNPFKL